MTLETKVDIEWLTKSTGDPFADAGGFVIKYLWTLSHLKDKDIIGLIAYMADIYVNKWDGKIHAFFLNSRITQAAFKGHRKIEEALKYYSALINETEDCQEGYCRISGRKTKLFPAGRDNHMLSGSGTFVNFHHNLEQGLFLSKEVLIRMFFVPFGLIQLGDKVAMINSNYLEISELFVSNNCAKNIRAMGSGISEGVLRSDFNNPANALFGFADYYLSKGLREMLIQDDESSLNDIDAVLNLYHFTNFGASPEVNIYVVNSRVFKFYTFCNRIRTRRDWNKFLRYYYRNSKYKNAVFSEEKEIWESKNEIVDYDSYKVWKNEILECLLFNKSILSNILKWVFNHKFPFSIVENYQIIIKGMEKKTIEKIKQIADFIVIGRDADFISKSIKRLNGEKSPHGLRQFFLKLNSENYQKQGTTPLITVQDYADYLFPDSGNWKEVRDVLLIAIYERLHEAASVIAVPSFDDNEESDQ